MKIIPYSNSVSSRGVALCTLLALAVFASVGGISPVPTLHANESASLETDQTFPDIENWAGGNWQAAGWPAIQLKKSRIERSIVQLGFDSVSPYNSGSGPNFLLRVKMDGRFVFLTNSREVAAKKSGTILMQKKGRIFEGILPSGGMLTDASIDYGSNTVHYSGDNLNPGNDNNPRFTSIRFIPRDANAGGELNGSVVSGWEPLSLGIPAYYAGANWSVAAWPAAKGKTIGKSAMVKVGFDTNSVYRGKTQGQNFLCRLVFKTGGTVFLTNSPEVARRKGDVSIMDQKDGCFEAIVSGLGELTEAAIDFGESTLAYGRGTWSLNQTNNADVRFNSLDIVPVTDAQPASAAPQAVKSAGSLQTAEFASPAYYGGGNWVVAVFTNARGHKLSGRNTTLRLHFDSASSFNTSENVNFLLRVVFENGKTIYASNSDKIVTAVPSGKTAKFSMNKPGRYFEGTLLGLGDGGVVTEIAVDFGESTSHLPVPLNEKNNNNPRFTKLTVLE